MTVTHIVTILNNNHTLGIPKAVSVEGSEGYSLIIPKHSSKEVDLVEIQHDELFLDTLCDKIDSTELIVKLDGTIQTSDEVGTWKYVLSDEAETNTASNLGSGEGLYAGKVGVDLQFKSIVDGSTKLSLASTSTELTVDVDETNIVHQNLLGAGSNTHAQLDTHVGDATKHRIINDSSTAVDELWSANKIDSELATKAELDHEHLHSPNVVFKEQFTGTGAQKTFNLTGTLLNGTFSSGSWDASHVLITFATHATKTTGKSLWDSTNIFTRHRISVSSISAAGVVTLDYAPQNSEVFYIWYWYDLQSFDVIDNYYREDFVASMESDGSDFVDPMTTRGDIIYKDSSNYSNRLPLGSASQVLYSDGTDITWQSLIGSDLDDWFGDRNGIVDTALSTISFDNPSYTFTIAPTGASFDYYAMGTKYTTTGDTKQIDNTKEGLHAIYYDGATLTETANPTNGEISAIIRTKALVCFLYWDVSASTAIYVGEERHGAVMSPSTHAYLHFTKGLAYIRGLGLNTFSLDGAGVTADAQFGVDAGSVSDEDLYLTINAVASTTGLPIYYLTGAAGDLNRSVVAGFSARTFDGTSATRLAYNQYTGGAWQLSQVTSGNYVLYHIFATTEKDKPMISLMGQNIYTNKVDAKAGAITEVLSLSYGDLYLPEIRPIASVLYQTNLAYANAINARIVSVDGGVGFVDWRSESVSRVALTTSDHGSLTGLGDDDHTQYLLAAGTRALAGDWSAGSNRLTNVKNLGYISTYDNGNSGAAFNLTLSNGQLQKVTLTSNAASMTIVDTGNIGDGMWIITVVQDGSGSRAITSSSVSGGTVLTEGGVALSFSSNPDDEDTMLIFKEGTKYRLKVLALDWEVWT